MFKNLTVRVQSLEAVYPEQDEGMKVLQNQVDNLATAIRQLGSPLNQKREDPEFNGLCNEYEERRPPSLGVSGLSKESLEKMEVDIPDGVALQSVPHPGDTHGQRLLTVVIYAE